MNEKGSLLIVALWAVSFFSLMTAALAFHAGEEMLLMKKEIRNFEARLDFDSALTEAARLVQEDPEPHEDHAGKPWHGDMKFHGEIGARLSARLTDEESKINLNEAPGTFLDAFLKRYEDEVGPLHGARKDYVKGILKLRYEKKIRSLEELFFMEGFDKADWEGLKPYVTVYPEMPFVNINTANPLVLRALVDSLSADHAAKRLFLERLDEARGKESLFFLSDDMTPNAFTEKLKLPQTALILQLLQELLSSLTTDSRTFRITLKLKNGAEAQAVFHCPGLERPEILYWHEEI